MARPMRPWTALASAAAAASVLLAGVGVGAAAATVHKQSSTPVYGGTLNLDTQTPPQKLDPAQVSDVVSGQFNYLIFNNLVTYAKTTAQIVPSLATSWSHNAAGTVWTFNLRKGVTFSNGDPFTATDVAFTLTRINEGVTNSPYEFSYAVIAGSQQCLAQTKTKPWPATEYLSGIKILNPYKIQITTTTPEQFFLNVLALPSASIEDASVAQNYFAQEKAGKQIDPVGTGPFILQPAAASTTLYVFKKNPTYWQKGLPYLNQVDVHIGADPTLQYAQFLKGQIDAMPTFLENFDLAPAQYLAMLKNPKAKADYFDVPDIGVNYLGFDVNTAPWNNVKVRQAVEYALNKKLLDEVLFNGRAPVANSILPPGMPGYQPNLNLYPANYATAAGQAAAQAKAKALLKAAGYPNGVNGGTFFIISGPGDTQQASLVKTDLAAVGIQVQPRIIGFNTFLNYGEAKPSKLGFYSLGWTQDYPDPQDFLFNLFDGLEAGQNNFDYSNNPQVNALLAKADSGTNQALRLQEYDQVQKMVMQMAWVVPFAFDFQDGLVGANVYPKTPAIWAHPVEPAELQYVWIAK